MLRLKWWQLSSWGVVIALLGAVAGDVQAQADCPALHDSAEGAQEWALTGGLQTWEDTQETACASSAGDDPLFPLHGQAHSGYSTLWYRLRTHAPGSLRLSSQGSSVDTLLGVWLVNPDGSLSAKPLKWNDNASNGKYSRLNAVLKGGQEVRIVLAAKTSAAGQLHLSARFQPAAAVNDSRVYAVKVPASSTAFTWSADADVWRATQAASDPPVVNAVLERTVWYRFKPVISGWLTLDTARSNYDTAAWVGYSGQTLPFEGEDAGTSVFQAKINAMPVVAGLTYFIEIGGHAPLDPLQPIPSLLGLDLDFQPWAAAGPGEYQTLDEPLMSSGNGWMTREHPSALGGDYVVTGGEHESAALTFNGRGVELVYARLPGAGKLRLWVDGKAVMTIDQRRSSELWGRVWRRRWTKAGTHTLTMMQTGSGEVNFDVIRVLP